MLFRKSLPEFHLIITLLIAVVVLSSQTQQKLWSGVFLTLSGLPIRVVHGTVKAVEDLHDEYLEDDLRVDELERLREENIQLKRKINLLTIDMKTLSIPPANIAATADLKVICRSRVVQTGFLITLDRGSLSGIRRNDGVISDNGLVGRVVQVTPFVSRILPLFNALSSISVVVPRSGDHGIASGSGQETLLLNFLPATSHLHIHDEVVTDGRDGLYPVGIPVGEILTLSRDEYATTARVAPGVLFTALDQTFVVREK